ncbi:MAG TPA: NAD(P)H-quinone oxidoreductase [Pyrinomonadaceae bacterium]|nr:NAD(P)H-quinone oxidoreductase [Pyrinomonadaceae bacterium]
MKAVLITSPGSIEVLEIREVETPSLTEPDSVRVRVRASALNRADVLQRRGLYPAPAGAPQDIPGLEFAGEIDETGENVHSWKRGQRVFGITGGGAHAQFVVVPADHLAEIPPNLDWVEAAAVPEAFITAHDALFTRANLQRNETVMVHAAGSGVGTAVSQMARASGARVFGTSRTADKLERAKQYGLAESLVVSDSPENIVTAVRSWTNGQGVDVIIDLVGASYLETNLKSLAKLGRMIFVGTTAGAKGMLDLSLVMGKRATLVGTVMRSRSTEEKATATRLFAQQVLPLLADGSVRPVVDKVYKLEEIREAHRRMESNESFGKIVLEVD